MKEYILCSAVHFDDGKEYVHQPINIGSGYVVCGMRHHNCYMTVSVLSNGIVMQDKEDIQGFITNRNRFVDRKEAMELVIENGQCHNGKLCNPRVGLFSEDLY